MALGRSLAGFCFRQVLGPVAGSLIGPVAGKLVAGAVVSGYDVFINHFTDHSETLPKALVDANERTWDALRYALSDGKWDTFKGLFKSADHKGITENLRQFLQGQDDGFRQGCLTELDAARKAGRLSIRGLTLKGAAGETARFNKYAPEKLHETSQQFVAVHIAADLKKNNYGDLADLVKLCPDGGLPLIVLTFSFFFRAELRDNDKLRAELEFEILENLSAGQRSMLSQLAELAENVKVGFGRMDAGFEDLAAGQLTEFALLDDIKTTQQAQNAKLDWLLEQQRFAQRNHVNPRDMSPRLTARGRSLITRKIHSKPQGICTGI